MRNSGAAESAGRRGTSTQPQWERRGEVVEELANRVGAAFLDSSFHTLKLKAFAERFVPTQASASGLESFMSTTTELN